LKRQAQLLGEGLHGRAAALPLPFGLEAQITDAAAPGRDDPANRPEITPFRVLLIEAPDDLWRDPDERT
jgi:hypothetical protein